MVVVIEGGLNMGRCFVVLGLRFNVTCMKSMILWLLSLSLHLVLFIACCKWGLLCLMYADICFVFNTLILMNGCENMVLSRLSRCLV